MKTASILSLKALLIIVALLTAPFSYASEEWLAKFAKQNDGKFSSEIGSIPKRVTVRSKPFDGWWTFSEYDQDRKVLTNSHIGTVWSQWIYEKCKPVGSFVGSNAFGAKATVQRSNCERLEIQDDAIRGLDIGSPDIEMSPQQFRDLKSKGPIYEIEFEVGKDTKQEVASVQTIYGTATISDPNQRKINVLRVNGKFEVLRILTPDGKTVLYSSDKPSFSVDMQQKPSSSSYSQSYLNRVISRIKPNIVIPDSLEGNPTSEIELQLSPLGEILSYKILISSGYATWDDAVIKAIEKTEILPKDVDGKTPKKIILKIQKNN